VLLLSWIIHTFMSKSYHCSRETVKEVAATNYYGTYPWSRVLEIPIAAFPSHLLISIRKDNFVNLGRTITHWQSGDASTLRACRRWYS